MKSLGSLLPVTIEELVDRYDGLLLDAYGVLVDHSGVIAGASELIAWLNAHDVPYTIVTNDASRPLHALAQKYERLGLSICESRIVNSGMLIEKSIGEHSLHGATCAVIGPQGVVELVKAAGGNVATLRDGEHFDCIVYADEDDNSLMTQLDCALSAVMASAQTGRDIYCLFPNPDIIYPRSAGTFGFTAGSFAVMLEAALHARFGKIPPSVHLLRLGKPYAPIFEEACRRVGSNNVVMVGDQLTTDIQGANNFGIASALVATGVARLDTVHMFANVPTYILSSLAFPACRVSG